MCRRFTPQPPLGGRHNSRPQGACVCGRAGGWVGGCDYVLCPRGCVCVCRSVSLSLSLENGLDSKGMGMGMVPPTSDSVEYVQTLHSPGPSRRASQQSVAGCVCVCARVRVCVCVRARARVCVDTCSVRAYV